MCLDRRVVTVSDTCCLSEILLSTVTTFVALIRRRSVALAGWQRVESPTLGRSRID